jgi:formylglycine-generating enzyme required for sulfatase activity
MAASGTGEKLKVFISYSRRDSSEFAEELLAGLELAGFAPFLDRHDIAPGEPWEERLIGLIQQADTVVYVISPEAVKSERCSWEVDKTIALSKRLMPVVFKPVSEADIPEQLRRRQFVRFDTGLGITRPLTQLSDALRQDLDWVREHTRMGELAARWEARRRPVSLLLRADELAAALSWAHRRKSDAPAISDLMRAYFAASKEAEAVSLAKSKAAQRRVRWLQAFAALCALVVVSALAGWWKQDWLMERVYVWRNVHVLTAAQEKALKPGDPPFKECTDCPEMVVVPSGSFTMGSPAPEGNDNEYPQRRVTITTPYAVSKFELTFEQWDTCVSYGNCIAHVSDNGWGRGLQPVINVSFVDAQSYVAWLSKITGKAYRLLSEAEYEYATRGGTQTIYPWGDFAGEGNANCKNCVSKWADRQTAPVGSFPPNGFGLHDMVGNISEWVQDCYHSDYDGAPSDGSAWVNGSCESRVVRGGAFDINIFNARSAGARLNVLPEFRNRELGFRVGRSLMP